MPIGALTRLSRLLRRETPGAADDIARALRASMADDLERSVIGAADVPGTTMTHVGGPTSVSVPAGSVSKLMRRVKRNTPIVDYHSHPVHRLGEGVSPSPRDLEFWAKQYVDDGRDYHFVVAQPPVRYDRDFMMHDPAAFTWFNTQRPQLLSPQRADDARMELQHAAHRGRFDNLLSRYEREELDAGNELQELMEPLSRFLLMRHDAALGRGRTLQSLTGRYSPDVNLTEQWLLDTLTPTALEVLKAKKFARGGRTCPSAR